MTETVMRKSKSVAAGAVGSLTISWAEDCFFIPKRIKIVPMNASALGASGYYSVAVGFEEVNNEDRLNFAAYDPTLIVYATLKGILLNSPDIILDDAINCLANIPSGFLCITVKSQVAGTTIEYLIEVTGDLIDYTPTTKALMGFGPMLDKSVIL